MSRRQPIERAVNTGKNSIEVRAYAKINLSLDVIAVRADGFHELRSVMQTISLFDSLRLFATSQESTVPADGHDFSLIDRALEAISAMAERRGIESPAIGYEITKRIPAGAGLGGGSADGATALRAASELVGIALSEGDLLAEAAKLGSDVPFFLTAGTALVEGRGEKVSDLADAPERWFLLANAGDHVSTRDVFGELRSDEFRRSEGTDHVLTALGQNRVVFGGNDLTPAAERVSAGVGRLQKQIRSLVPSDRVMLTGSGGTVVALFETPDAARAIHEALLHVTPTLQLVSSVTRQTAHSPFRG